MDHFLARAGFDNLSVSRDAIQRLVPNNFIASRKLVGGLAFHQRAEFIRDFVHRNLRPCSWPCACASRAC